MSASRAAAALIAVVVALAAPAQQPVVRLTGKVVDQARRPVAGAAVTLRETAPSSTIQATTDSKGTFELKAEAGVDAEVTASKQGLTAQTHIAAGRLAEPVELMLVSASSASSVANMEFSDDPHFAVAGVTDWTAVGGHGSDSTLRTSESLATTTASLPGGEDSSAKTTAEEFRMERELRQEKLQGHADFAGTRIHAALQSHPSATLYRLAAETDESNGDPLAAVREFEQAAKLEPSETNEFEWGSDLLVHRAIWQAEAVFQHGAQLYPGSVRMQTALGTALFAGARYDEAADRFCKAADMAPDDEAAYLVLGKVELAAPNPLACAESRLERFVRLRPESAEARYLYAVAIIKGIDIASRPDLAVKAEQLFRQAIGLDAKCAEAYFRLGILAMQRQDLPAAIDDFTQAIAADPTQVDAYYRLAKMYERTGNDVKAKATLRMYEKIKQSQAQAVEQQRKAVKQFTFANSDGVPTTSIP